MADSLPRTSTIAGASTGDRTWLAGRFEELELETPDADLGRLLGILTDESFTGDALRDALSTQLMELFRIHRCRASFGMLYELNQHHLLQQVAGRLRRYGSKADPGDVLQEVFFNVYRYPHRFNCARDDAFRVWTATIVRNTVLKHLRSMGRSGRFEVPFEDLTELPEVNGRTPLKGVIEEEARAACHRVYVTYLHLYLRFYTMLSEREQRALHLVEVEERSYRQAALELTIKLENLKMVIFRARRKIHRAMRRTFDGLPHDCRPAREPRQDSTQVESTPAGGNGTPEGADAPAPKPKGADAPASKDGERS
jgi:RNA polymerase sigma factor (sigma-70 family)